ncbi:hypothetical protein [Aestuariivivens sediminis]|uniref:hypothetical protein n=1 Tax=Aestuariivivens sediminis TaxID=2913557 RepID=UPI003B8A5B21
MIKQKTNSKSNWHIRCRQTFAKKRKECSTGLLMNPKNWNAKKQFVESPEPDPERINT